MYHHHRFKGRGRTQNVSYIFQGVFDGILDRFSPQKRYLGDVQRPILHLRGVPKNVSYILVWSPSEKLPQRVGDHIPLVNIQKTSDNCHRFLFDLAIKNADVPIIHSHLSFPEAMHFYVSLSHTSQRSDFRAARARLFRDPSQRLHLWRPSGCNSGIRWDQLFFKTKTGWWIEPI